MPRREILDRIQKYVDPFRVATGNGFRLNSVDPADTCGLQLGKGEAAELLARGTQWLAEEQDMLYRRTVGLCCWYFRRWTRRARTARLSMSCQASIRRDARFSRSSSHPGR